MERRQKENKPIKSKAVVKTIVGLVGSIAVGAIASWAMPKMQKKIADKIYKKMT